MNKFYPFLFILLWSSAFVSGKIIVQSASPFASLSFRFCIVALGFLLFAYLMKEKIIPNKSLIYQASITGIFLGFTFGFSIFIGAIAGIFYLRLLAKSIGKLGKESSGVSKLQLLVPVCLFIFASKLGSLDIFPVMIGFFIYKPSLIFYFSRS